MDIYKSKIQAALGTVKADLVLKNGLVFNVFTEQFEKKNLAVKDGYIVGLGEYSGEVEVDLAGKAVVPGFIDGHVHLESSLISPREYCKTVLPHGTTTIVTDPHEICNVLGTVGFEYMLKETENLPLDVFFMVPSCVPATSFDESGARLDSEAVKELLSKERVLGLAEMMNYPGVLGLEEDTLKKISATEQKKLCVDGHAPGLGGTLLNAYVAAGVVSDHECTNAEEAKEKIGCGQWVMIREGTACKNLDSLLPLFEKPYCDRCMLVTDDKHPGELKLEGHIDYSIRKAIAGGAPAEHAYKMASYNAASYFGLKHTGALAPGYLADFIVLEDVEHVKIHSVYRRGICAQDCLMELSGQTKEENPYARWAEESIHIPAVTADNFRLKKEQEKVIGLVPHEILTTDEGYASEVSVEQDICKLAVVERHQATGHIGVAFVKGYGLRQGAVATSIAHDAHNIIVAGTNDADMAYAVEQLKEMHGGMVLVENGKVLEALALPIAGLMCEMEAELVEDRLAALKERAYELGVKKDIDPFMTLSFASLAVIPELRLTTKGVVDVRMFQLC